MNNLIKMLSDDEISKMANLIGFKNKIPIESYDVFRNGIILGLQHIRDKLTKDEEWFTTVLNYALENRKVQQAEPKNPYDSQQVLNNWIDEFPKWKKDQTISEDELAAFPENMSLYIIIGEIANTDFQNGHISEAVMENVHMRLFDKEGEKKAYLQALQDVTEEVYYTIISKDEFYKIFYPDAFKALPKIGMGIDPVEKGGVSFYQKMDNIISVTRPSITKEDFEKDVKKATSFFTGSQLIPETFTIKDLNGTNITVTDIHAALKQATNCVELHEEAKLAHDAGHDVIYHADAHKEWNHILTELKKINNAAQ